MADTPSRGGVAGIPLSPYQVTVNYGSRIAGASGQASAWFGPLPPLNPLAPPEVAGRQFDFVPGFNLNTVTRAYSPITFADLRGFADGYDLMRLVIETRKDQVCRMGWSIKAKDGKNERVGVAEAITQFFQRPDGRMDWEDWLRMLLEDLFVIDAASIYMHRDNSGRLIGLLPMDGATIKPVIDDWGRTPYPIVDGGNIVYPVAFQQILKGYPAVDYTEQDLIYRPRNRRTNRVYGFSPVEQIISTVNIALRRQAFTLDYYTEGNIPASLIGVPDTWTPDQIAAYQRYWDSYFEGNEGRRRKAKFVPGGVAKTFIQTQEPDLKNVFDEWLARLVCFAFSVTPQGLVTQQNRATAETQKDLSEEEGLFPIMSWIKGIIDPIIALELGAPDLEFAWGTDEQIDPAQQQTILTAYVNGGVMTINEARAQLKLSPSDNPAADLLMTSSGTGFVPIGANTIEGKQANLDAFGPPPAAMTEPIGAVENSKENQDNTGDDGKAGKGGSEPSSKVLNALFDKASAGGPTDHVPFTRKRVVAAEERFRTTIAAALTATGRSVAAHVRAALKGLGKVGPGDSDPDNEAERIASDLPFDFMAAASDVLGDALAEAIAEFVVYNLAEVAEVAGARIGVANVMDLVNQVNPRAVKAASERAANLVSLKGEDSIVATTREMIRRTIAQGLADNIGSDAIAEALETGYAFSEDRADLIAKTEISMANGDAALESYRSAAAIGIKVKKEWLVAPQGCCPICGENRDAGAIELDATFPSGHATSPAHPRCRCTVSPVVEDETAEKAYNPDQPRGNDGKWSSSGLGAVNAAAPAIDEINRALGLALPAGGAYMPAKVHSKMKDKRPDDYNFVMRNLNAVLRKPDYVGIDAHHPEHINLVKRVDGGKDPALLVSISKERSSRKSFAVVTAHPIAEVKIQAKLSAGYLKATKKGR